jgi:hypothetical protein
LPSEFEHADVITMQVGQDLSHFHCASLIDASQQRIQANPESNRDRKQSA